MSGVTFNIDHRRDIERITKAAEAGVYAVATRALSDSNLRAPKDKNGLIESSTSPSDLKKGLLVWDMPYARYLYYGILMVDSETGSSWARKYSTKVKVDKELKYNTAKNAKAGKMWAHRAYAENREMWRAIMQKAFSEELKNK